MARISHKTSNRPVEFHEALAAQTPYLDAAIVPSAQFNWMIALTVVAVTAGFIALMIIGRNLLTTAVVPVSEAGGQVGTVTGNPSLQTTASAGALQGTASTLQTGTTGGQLQANPSGGSLQGSYNSNPAGQ